MLSKVFPLYRQVGGTALHYAASKGHVEVARELLNHKAYVNGRTKVCIDYKLQEWINHVASDFKFEDGIQKIP